MHYFSRQQNIVQRSIGVSFLFGSLASRYVSSLHLGAFALGAFTKLSGMVIQSCCFALHSASQLGVKTKAGKFVHGGSVKVKLRYRFATNTVNITSHSANKVFVFRRKRRGHAKACPTTRRYE